MASELGAREDGSCSELAKPLYLQYLEKALQLDQFLRQTSAIFNRSISSDESEDGLDDNPLLPQSGDPLMQVKEEPPNSLLGESSGAGNSGMLSTHSLNGVLQPEPKSEKGSLYNFSKLKKSRKWLKSILLSDDSSDTDSPSDEDGEEEEEFTLSREELHNMLRLHKYKKLHQSKYSKDKELQQYQYYSAGLLSTHDPYYEQQRHLIGPKKRKFKEEKKLKGKLKKVKKKRRRDEELSSEESPRRHHHQTKVFAKFSHDTPPPGAKKKHLTIEQLNARRRKVWLSIVKKELPKAYKQKASARNLFLTNSKKLAHQCMREVRRAAIQAQKNCKETLPRARRLTKEMLLYWKKYEKVEKEHRKRAEKEALEQRKLDEEMREAKRQQRKLNFLITQTELYAHFMSRKRDIGHDGIQEEILRKLEDSSTQRQIDIGGGVVVNITQEVYDSNYYKAQALKNAEDAYQIHQARTRSFDEDAKESRAAALRAANKSGTGFGESYSLANPSIRAGEDIPQPTIFNGKLKGYQLKGMNWLANLYEQGINGILADEMGLGKTVQSIALLAHLAERENIWGPFLIISPASTLNNWHQEFARFVPKFKVLPYWGNPHDRKVIRKFWSQKTLYTQDAPFHVVITSYQLVVQDVKYFQRVKWQYMVLDEAQALKSSSSVRWKILLQFQCRNRLLLTGTPIQNTMAELWALLHFIMPTLFDSHEEFNEWFSKDIESHAENKSAIDENQLSRLHMILKPFMLRRIKKDVENELSDKIEILMYCQQTSRQKLLYQALKNKISIDDLLQSSMGTTQQAQTTTSSLMNLVMQFRKVCNHPELFERQETWSPFHISLKPYQISKFIYRHGQIRVFNHSRDRWLRVLLSPFAPDHIQQSLFHRKGINEESCFSFLRFIDVSPAEMANLMNQGHLARWLALFLSLKASYRLHHMRSWAESEGEKQQGSCCLRNRDFLLDVNFPLSFPNLHSCTLLQGINGILADEMGLGKTVQSIALLAHLAERENIWGPFLIISPASTLNNWHQEFARFVPKFKVLPYWGNPHDRKVIRKFWSQKTLYTQDAPFHVVITSYQLVVQDVKYFQRVKWQYMVLDEAQALKSSSSVRWKILLQFQCRNRLLLTGTPIQNTMAELWALLHFIMPTLFDSHEEFNEWFSKDIESHAENKSAIDENQLSRLHMILKPFMLRRIKKDVENELSDKIEILMYCQQTSRQKLLYQALKNKISIDDLLQSSMGTTQQAQTTTSSLMNLVMQFRKVCNHPELFERQETWSPFHISLKPYQISKFIYRHGQIRVFNHSRDRWLRVLLSPFAPDHIQQSLFHRKGINEESCFSFLRFIDVSPAEMANLMNQGHLARWLALFLSLKASYRLHHMRSWAESEGEKQQGSCCLRNRDFLLDVNFPLSFPNLHSCTLLQVTTPLIRFRRK
ncbi:PREDICTED: DNA helicase INO80-like [Calidris pugnax]|uniref:DNA helicase INO80-like n=1 Tax=Calidris pugnax TaxID=198806 RepID=UPI00071D9D98|nr:PREDICTED: DNA helicase INO80-like [Calidris pugnax]